MTEINVKLVSLKNTILKEYKFNMQNSKLPVTQICKHFQIKDLVWSDIDEPLPADDNGYSKMTFAGMNSINVRGTAL
ncbi:hypothetical protein RB653_003592 [Dictyostelium firmibasis]|uniref:Uncharacterized protein n=1 Tax=Dictyostelium firmibasis TaxID=79012 RepID=A0AAN7U616_9MYCE